MADHFVPSSVGRLMNAEMDHADKVRFIKTESQAGQHSDTMAGSSAGTSVLSSVDTSSSDASANLLYISAVNQHAQRHILGSESNSTATSPTGSAVSTAPSKLKHSEASSAGTSGVVGDVVVVVSSAATTVTTSTATVSSPAVSTCVAASMQKYSNVTLPVNVPDACKQSDVVMSWSCVPHVTSGATLSIATCRVQTRRQFQASHMCSHNRALHVCYRALHVCRRALLLNSRAPVMPSRAQCMASAEV